ncbi:MAG: PAS domain-containing protein, partial [Deltaproteobacteria bacterium]|nr:PAS domain-containing protein [Deltaproteobacteria bacterium]
MKRSVRNGRKGGNELDGRIRESVLASSINGLAIGTLEGTVTYVNEAALSLFGYEEEEIIGRSAFIFAESQEEAARAFNTLHNEGQWMGEIAGRRKDGSIINVHLSANLVTDEEGRPLCMMCSFIDITERKMMEEELRIKDNAIASSINGIAIGGLDGTITSVNEAAVRLWGGDDPAELIGQSAVKFAQSEDEALEIIQTVLNEGGWEGEVSGIKKQGEAFVAYLSASLVRNERGEPVCMMCSFVDITERKRMEEELRIRNDAIASSLNG